MANNFSCCSSFTWLGRITAHIITSSSLSLYWKIYIFQMKIAKRFSESIRRCCSLLSRWNICFSFQITLTIASKFVCAAAKRRQSDLNLLNVPPGAPTAPRWSSSPQEPSRHQLKTLFSCVILWLRCRERESEWVSDIGQPILLNRTTGGGGIAFRRIFEVSRKAYTHSRICERKLSN